MVSGEWRVEVLARTGKTLRFRGSNPAIFPFTIHNSP